MPYRLRIDLFDTDKAIALRRQAKVHIAKFDDPLSLDTLTGLPVALDAQARNHKPLPLPELEVLFPDWITVDEGETARPVALDTSSIVPTSSIRPRPQRRQPASVISPPFAPLRQLDYRFTKISIDWRDMLPKAEPSSTGGSMDVGFGVIHLFRDASDVYKSDLPLPRTETGSGLIEGNGTLVAVLNVPPVMSVPDFLIFVEPATEYIRQIRILREEGPNRCMAMIRFRAIEEAEQFIKAFNGKPYFAMLEDEICQVIRIAQVELRTSANPPFTFAIGPELEPPPSSGITNAVELPTCVVCLERMDANITGLITIPCQHSFHCTCLAKWANGKCPICRYTQSKLVQPKDQDEPQHPSACDQCGTESRLWMCLICGHVGCGRYNARHAISHYEQTQHQYAMELESQRVWDYAGDQYVHRLIQNGRDGRVVELPSSESHHPSTSEEKRKGLGPDEGDVMTQSKVERISEEFAHLLAQQLESQRNYYSEKIGEVKKDAAAMRSEVDEQVRYWKGQADAREQDLILKRNEVAQLSKANDQFAQRIKELETHVLPAMESEKQRVDSKLEKALEMSRGLQKELLAEKEVTRGLMGTIHTLKDQVRLNESSQATMRIEMNELQEQVSDLLANLSFRNRVEQIPELQGSNLGVKAAPTISAPPPKPSTRRKKKPKKPPLAITTSEVESEPQGDQGDQGDDNQV